MVKRLAIVGLLSSVLVFAPVSVGSAHPLEGACSDIYMWLSGAVPLGFLELACTINEDGQPVTNVLEPAGENVDFELDSDTEQYGTMVQESGLPEETKQQLLLLLVIWSQQ